MAEKRMCGGCGKTYWWPGERWQHEKHVSVTGPSRVTKAEKVVVDAQMVVDTVVDAVSHANAVVVDSRTTDRHRKTVARRLYLRMKQRESRARRAGKRVSA